MIAAQGNPILDVLIVIIAKAGTERTARITGDTGAGIIKSRKHMQMLGERNLRY